jgi:hypothetical protein
MSGGLKTTGNLGTMESCFVYNSTGISTTACYFSLLGSQKLPVQARPRLHLPSLNYW